MSNKGRAERDRMVGLTELTDCSPLMLLGFSLWKKAAMTAIDLEPAC